MIKCCECAHYGQCKPDMCISKNEHGDIIYNNFKNPKDDRSRFCERCGQRLVKGWNKKLSNEAWKKSLRCPICGIVGDLEVQYVSRGRDGQVK